MLDIIKISFLDTSYFDVPMNYFEFCIEVQLGNL